MERWVRPCWYSRKASRWNLVRSSEAERLPPDRPQKIAPAMPSPAAAASGIQGIFRPAFGFSFFVFLAFADGGVIVVVFGEGRWSTGFAAVRLAAGRAGTTRAGTTRAGVGLVGAGRAGAGLAGTLRAGAGLVGVGRAAAGVASRRAGGGSRRFAGATGSLRFAGAARAGAGRALGVALTTGAGLADGLPDAIRVICTTRCWPGLSRSPRCSVKKPAFCSLIM